MSIGLLLEFIVFQENSLTRREIMLLIVTTKMPTELMPVFSAVAQWAEVVIRQRFPIQRFSLLLQWRYHKVHLPPEF